jgi:predicted methyltransferase
MKSTWRIINEEKGMTKSGMDVQSLVINNKLITNQNEIANMINNYFITITETIQPNNKHSNTNVHNPIKYLANNFRRPFPKIGWQSSTTYEIENIEPTSSSGYDDISTRIIKLSAPVRK